MKRLSAWIRKDLAAPFIWCVITACGLPVFFRCVDLKPKVEENFFFSNNDPELQADKTISELFPLPSQIVLCAKGDIRSEDYLQRVRQLTDETLKIPEVMDVQSLTRGPRDLDSALKSPLWRDTLIARDQKSSLAAVFLKQNASAQSLIGRLEEIKKHLNSPGKFELMISGAPYIVEIIGRDLLRDLKIFSLVAFLVFTTLVWILFRSLAILAGTILSCLDVGMLTLSITNLLKIKIGPLTSNLSVIVFVLALSHVIFLTFNWKQVSETNQTKHTVREAVRITLPPSFWSMVTQLMGFASLLLVKAMPLRQLGVAGFVGTLSAFCGVYLIYPSFLHLEAASGGAREPGDEPFERAGRFFEKSHARASIFLIVLSAGVGLGILGLNKDPSLLSYFKKGGEIRNGLEYIDRNGGSTPLNLVVSKANGDRLDTEESYKDLWRLQLALQHGPTVGTALSMPLILAEARSYPLATLIPTDWILRLLESKLFGGIAKSFISGDRKETLFLLSMKEDGRKDLRSVIIKRIGDIVKAQGFTLRLVGGVYFLQSRLSALVVSSIVVGLSCLIICFTMIGGLILRSARVARAIAVSLGLIPLWTIGLIGYGRIPFDIISSPGVNIAIGIGVDSILNMLFFVRRHRGSKRLSAALWAQASAQLWRPILYSTLIVCIGFGIFVLSAFPPTQRFGLSVVLGTLMTPFAALFVFPWIARPRRVRIVKEGSA